MYVDVLLGLQWGDEGKGKIVDYLAPQYDIIARFQGGPNAGHTLKVNGENFVLHTIPSGIFHPDKINVVGNGVVIDPATMLKEIQNLAKLGVDASKNLYVCKRAHLIMPTHKLLDAASEKRKGDAKIGSTLRGIGPAYMDKTGRNGLRVGDILAADFQDRYNKLKEKHFELIRHYGFDPESLEVGGEVITQTEARWMEGVEALQKLKTIDSPYFLEDFLKSGKTVLAEGAQGSMLDIDFGTYPFVTSSNTISAGACKGLGVSPQRIREVFGITKAYCTRVGSGPFPTELNDATGELLRAAGSEFGATTGRPRRCGWMDLPALRYANTLSGVTQLIVTKIDVLDDFEQLEVCHAYEINGAETTEVPYRLEMDGLTPLYKQFPGWQCHIDDAASFDQLPDNLKNYIGYIEDYLGTPVSIISNGPGREQLILKNPSLISA